MDLISPYLHSLESSQSRVLTAYNEHGSFTCTCMKPTRISLIDYSRPISPNTVTNEPSESPGPLLETKIESRQLITLKEWVKPLKGSVWSMLCRYRLCVNGDLGSYVQLCPSMYIQPIVLISYGVDDPLYPLTTRRIVH